ncbi:MAG: hypothetical protein DWQ34_02530 [Planctomycetota bacterium]|nr:MAG: hypothetical protein DWQ29_18380 [Planctomycetota bacterium]REJ97219.1 MAG: hypothetical protein DWQ34_02530 [Planctomycetota bacterium]REK30331.1 MAG: hypothetical protein DWQ41_02230 [Planctomycetota bacterium]REK31518.1 MAG: hypothetical protein DWQ45_19530 [Planctomycetota bacterium]
MELLESLLNLLVAILEVLAALAKTIAPWWPLIAWVAFWSLAVNWVSLRKTLLSGGWIGLVLIGLMMILVWGCVWPPDAGHETIFGLKLSNFVAKTVWVTGLIVIMLLCGSVQLSGACDRYLNLEQPDPDAGHDHH